MAKQSKRFLATRPLLPFIPGNPIEKCRTAQEKPYLASNFEYIHVCTSPGRSLSRKIKVVQGMVIQAS